MNRYDAIVCGGGPAGSCAAWRMARGGLSCLLIEAKGVPREKVCGGALSMRARNALTSSGMCMPAEIAALSLREQDSMSCCYRFEQLRLYRSTEATITMADRLRLDRFLLDRAASSGAEVIAGDPVEGFEGPGTRVRTRSGRSFEGDAMIGADGASGPVGTVFRGRGRRHPAGVGMEYTVPMPEGFPGHIQIHFGLSDYGYAWVFPRSDDICIGIGGFDGRDSARHLRSELDGLIRSLGLEPPPRDSLRAAPLPCGKPDGSLGSGNVFLAGDAAGLTDQLTGEGISHAVESGLMAAEAVLAGMDRKGLVAKAGAGCLGLVRQSLLARHLVYHPWIRKRAMRGLKEKQKFFEGYWMLMCGALDYRRMLLGFLRSP